MHSNDSLMIAVLAHNYYSVEAIVASERERVSPFAPFGVLGTAQKNLERSILCKYYIAEHVRILRTTINEESAGTNDRYSWRKFC